MGRSAIPKYRKRSDGYAFVEHYSIPTKSHRMALGRFGTDDSLKAYRKFLDDIAGLGKVTTTPGKWVTIDQMVEAYLIYARQRYMREDGLTSEFEGMVHALGALEHIGRTTGDLITPKTITTIRSQLVKAGYYRTTINHMVSRIKKFIRWCCQEELCPSELYHQLMSIAGLVKGEESALEPPPVQPAALESLKGVLPYLRPTVAAMVEVQFRCGLRPNEACRMGMQFIDSSRPTWLYFPEKHKNEWRGATSVKAVPPSAQKILAPFVKNEPYFFTTGRAGALYTTSGYRQAVTRGFKAAEKKGVVLERFKPNQLRHSIATHLAQTLGHRAAQVWCGHDKPNTTALYIAKQSAELIQISDELEATWTST